MLWFSFTQFTAWMGHLRIFFSRCSMCMCTSVCCLCVHDTLPKLQWERGCSLLTGRWSLSLSLEVFHFTPHYTCLFLSACCLSFTVLQNPHLLFSSSCAMVSLPLNLSLCLPCWQHVKCQVQSQLTDLLWHVCVYKTCKVMSLAAVLFPLSHPLLCPGGCLYW